MLNIRRSLNNLSDLGGQELDDWQFMRYVTWKNDWEVKGKVLSHDASNSKGIKRSKFYDYAPMVFKRIRKVFGITEQDYMQSLGPEQVLAAFMHKKFDYL